MNKNLVGYRKMAGYTQEQMAILANVCLTSYNHKETGKNEFTRAEMILITKALKERIPDITMDDIFFKEKVINSITVAS